MEAIGGQMLWSVLHHWIDSSSPCWSEVYVQLLYINYVSALLAVNRFLYCIFKGTEMFVSIQNFIIMILIVLLLYITYFVIIVCCIFMV